MAAELNDDDAWVASQLAAFGALVQYYRIAR